MWLIPKTLSLSVPGSECWTKDSMPDSDTLASRAGRLPMSSGKVTLPASLLRSWKANAWMRRLCGAAIWQDSHSQDFEDWYTASLLASPASLTPSPGSGPGLKMSGGSGRPLCKAYATLTPIGFISKTFQGSLLQADSQPALLILPRQGSMWNGELYERPTLVHRISGKESSSSPSDKAWSRWDTPDTMPEMPNTGSNRKAQPAGLGNQAQIVTNWKTPHGMAGIDHTGKIGGGGEFAKQVEQWATPQARDEKSPDSPDSQNYARKLEAGWTIDLNSQAGAWPTPCARDHKGANAEAGLTRADGGGAHGSISERCGLFAPGPSDPRWAGIIRDFPWLAPATQPGVCCVVDGVAFTLDASRRNQLRAIGNGVVPIQAAFGFVQLARRFGN